MSYQVRQRRLILVGLLLAGVCAGVGGCARAGDAGDGSARTADAPPPSAVAVIPLATLVAGVASARYADYAGRSGIAVRNEAAFEEMRRYLVDRYASATAAQSVTSDGVVFDCIRQPGGVSPATPVPEAATTAAATTAAAVTATTAVAPGATDAPASPVPALCPNGTVPVRRVTLDDLVRFPTLGDFLGKGPGRDGLPPTTG
jgi:hypothetical protein